MLKHLKMAKGHEMLAITLQLWWRYLLQLDLLKLFQRLQHCNICIFALLDIMVIIDVKTVMPMIVVITVMYIMSVIVILDATLSMYCFIENNGSDCFHH